METKKARVSGFFLFALIGCGQPPKAPEVVPPPQVPLVEGQVSPRGTLIEASSLGTLSQEALAEKFKSIGLSARYGVQITRLVYQTEDLEGRSVNASGIVLKPLTEQPSFPWISLQHGTITAQADAPSNAPSEGLFEASQGFYTVVADYLGYGSSRGEIHPYMIADGYVTAGVDLLRAARQWALQNTDVLGPLFLKGYSEGGYATLALQRALETTYASEFELRASAPAAGPYDLSGTSRILLARPTNNPVNLPFVLLSYERWMPPEGRFELERILKPDLSLVRQLFSGNLTNGQIYQELPKATNELFAEDLLADYTQDQPKLPESQQLFSWLRSQNLHDKGWFPQSPTRFYHCTDDETVPVQATLTAVASFEAQGAEKVEVTLIDSPDPTRPYTHVSCPAIFSSVSWFTEFL